MKAIIEIARGSDRRVHWNKERKEFVDLGPIKKVIPVNNGIMPADYGFLVGTLCEGDNDEIDVLIISDGKFKTGSEAEVEPVGILFRADKDDKIVAVDETTKGRIKEWESLDKNLKDALLASFGYHSAIERIGNKDEAEGYINKRLK